MGQRKLDGFEKHWITSAATSIRALMVGCGCEHRWDEQFADLLAVADSGTTDGKPWIEPQPEVGEGYRPTAEADKGRRDLEFWSKTGGGWQHRKSFHGAPLGPDYHYRVPVDRIPTDEDAKQRPTVMVRDSDDQNWKPATLLALRSGSLAFVATTPSNLLSSWAQARFPYPGELD